MTDTEKLKSLISGLEGKTTYSRLEPLMQDIDRKIKEGVPRAEIHKLITAQGINITEATFHTYLQRYRKRNSTIATKEKPSNKQQTLSEQNGNSAQPKEEQTPSQLPAQVENEASPSLNDMLTNENAREEFTNQFMTTRPIRRKK